MRTAINEAVFILFCAALYASPMLLSLVFIIVLFKFMKKLEDVQ